MTEMGYSISRMKNERIKMGESKYGSWKEFHGRYARAETKDELIDALNYLDKSVEKKEITRKKYVKIKGLVEEALNELLD